MQALLKGTDKQIGDGQAVTRPGYDMRLDGADDDMEIDTTGEQPGLDQTILDVKIISGQLREEIIIPLLNNAAKGKNWGSLEDTFTVVTMDFQTHAT